MIMNERLARIRESERKSHTAIYTNEKLYHSDSWLQRPIKTVREIVPTLKANGAEGIVEYPLNKVIA